MYTITGRKKSRQEKETSGGTTFHIATNVCHVKQFPPAADNFRKAPVGVLGIGAQYDVS